MHGAIFKSMATFFSVQSILRLSLFVCFCLEFLNNILFFEKIKVNYELTQKGLTWEEKGFAKPPTFKWSDTLIMKNGKN
jgi:hypothetical protein